MLCLLLSTFIVCYCLFCLWCLRLAWWLLMPMMCLLLPDCLLLLLSVIDNAVVAVEVAVSVASAVPVLSVVGDAAVDAVPTMPRLLWLLSVVPAVETLIVCRDVTTFDADL
jgi:hypothetical protein